MGKADLFGELSAIVGEGNVRADEPMSAHTTFKIGGPADFFVRPTKVGQVKQVMDACAQAGVPVRFMGLGSNLLVADAGLRGAVVQLADNLSNIFANPQTGVVLAQAGARNSAVANQAYLASLTGYEFASGIPGSIGGAAIMNAGAYDGQFSDVAVQLVCLDASGSTVRISGEQARFGYRSSRMNDEHMVVLSTKLQLARGDKVAIRARMDDLNARRRDKQPLDMPSAGSTFKRPEGHYAGQLIQEAGLQGFSVGGAQVSRKHAGFVVNTGDATAEDVRNLIAAVQQRVFENAGVRLEPEVRMWGFDDEA